MVVTSASYGLVAALVSKLFRLPAQLLQNGTQVVSSVGSGARLPIRAGSEPSQ